MVGKSSEAQLLAKTAAFGEYVNTLLNMLSKTTVFDRKNLKENNSILRKTKASSKA